MTETMAREAVWIGALGLPGELVLPAHCAAVVVFAHGSGSSRLSPRNRRVAAAIVAGGIGTLLFDLLTVAEERRDRLDASLRFDIGLLTERLAGATRWLDAQDWARSLTRGYFGASTGAAAALTASIECKVSAIVSRGGRPDLAGQRCVRRDDGHLASFDRGHATAPPKAACASARSSASRPAYRGEK